MTEKWAPIADLENLYEASTNGQIRRRQNMRILKQRKMNGRNGKKPYLVVMCSVRGKYQNQLVHRLVLKAHRGNPEPGQEARHRNGDATDNRLSNLVWGTHQENCADQKRHGTHPNTVKTRCPAEHEYTETNTYYGSKSERKCRECKRQWDREQYQKRKREGRA